MGVRHISAFMKSAFMVMELSSLAWFPFFVFYTVWISTEEIQTGMNWKLLYTMARGTRRSFWALIQLNSVKNQLLVDCTTLLKVRITKGDPNLLHDGSQGTLACLQLWHALP